jgi:hypothetical protein
MDERIGDKHIRAGDQIEASHPADRNVGITLDTEWQRPEVVGDDTRS